MQLRPPYQCEDDRCTKAHRRKFPERIIEFCSRRTVPGCECPIFIAVTPEVGSEADDCFEIVRRKTQQEGGRIQYGWAIWEWPRVFIDGQSITRFTNRRRVSRGKNLTPCQRKSRQRLFLPDDSATYDFQNEGFRRDNRRIALSEDSDIDELFKAAKKRSEFYNELPGVGKIAISEWEAKKLEKIERRLARATELLAQKYGAH